MAYENSENPGAPADVDAANVDEFVVYENLIVWDGEPIGGWFESKNDALRWCIEFIEEDTGLKQDEWLEEAIIEWFLDDDRCQYADVAVRRWLHD